MEKHKDYEALVNQLLDVLKSRGGFNGFWDYVDEDNQEEIKDELAQIIDDFIIR